MGPEFGGTGEGQVAPVVYDIAISMLCVSSIADFTLMWTVLAINIFVVNNPRDWRRDTLSVMLEIASKASMTAKYVHKSRIPRSQAPPRSLSSPTFRNSNQGAFVKPFHYHKYTDSQYCCRLPSERFALRPMRSLFFT